MAATLKTVEGGRVTSMDDAAVRWALSNQNGIIQGCETTLSGNTVTVQPGRIMIYGRLVDITLTEITIPYTTTTQQGAVYVEIQPENAQQPAQIGVMSAEGYVSLTQEDLMNGGTTYQIALATFTVNANTVSGFTVSDNMFITAAALVEESGSNDTWNWMKYSDGNAIAWGAKEFTFGTAQGWDSTGVLKYAASTGTAFPFTFAKAPQVWLEKDSFENMDLLTISKAADTTTTPSMRIIAPGLSNNTSHTIGILAIGKWK